MSKTVYSLKKHGDLEEYHLFQAELTQTQPNRQCTPQSKSICQKMNNKNSSESKFVCLNEEQARKKCADIGRVVCGVCVSHLYASY